jgi:hypothetical protein
MQAKCTFLRIHPKDNVLVALQGLEQGTLIDFEGDSFSLNDNIAGLTISVSVFSLTPKQPGATLPARVIAIYPIRW